MTLEGYGSEREKRRYHHGDLRRELLRMAAEEIARNGAEAVSIASLARFAGVSQPAPYRHFADRAALLEAVAAQAFDDLTAKLAQAVARRRSRGAPEALALAYLSFGEANIEIYRLMFASGLTPRAAAGSKLNEAAARAFALLRATMSSFDPRMTEADIYVEWARLHGLVMLKADGFIRSALLKFAVPIGRT